MGMLESWDLSKTILTRDGPGKKDNRCRQAGEGGKRETGRLWEIDVEVGGARTGDKVGKVQSKSLAMGAKKKKEEEGEVRGGCWTAKSPVDSVSVRDAALQSTLRVGNLGGCFGKDAAQ